LDGKGIVGMLSALYIKVFSRFNAPIDWFDRVHLASIINLIKGLAKGAEHACGAVALALKAILKALLFVAVKVRLTGSANGPAEERFETPDSHVTRKERLRLKPRVVAGEILNAIYTYD
jgi:hypothetical protein